MAEQSISYGATRPGRDERRAQARSQAGMRIVVPSAKNLRNPDTVAAQARAS